MRDLVVSWTNRLDRLWDARTTLSWKVGMVSRMMLILRLGMLRLILLLRLLLLLLLLLLLRGKVLMSVWLRLVALPVGLRCRGAECAIH